MFEDTYKTIKNQAEGLYKEKGSKFISHAYNCKNEEEIKEHLSNLRNTYHDARHHCFAWMLGANKDAYRINDDGEPSGTAGRPILGQIRSNDLTDILIVVVRYFGGTKLGVSGLINAYKNAAADALNNAEIIEMTLVEIYGLSFKYAAMNDIMTIMKEPEINIINTNFELECNLVFSVRRNSAEAYLKRIRRLPEVKIKHIGTQ